MQTRTPTRYEKRAASRAGVTCETFGENMNTARRATTQANKGGKGADTMRAVATEAARAALQVHADWGHLDGYGGTPGTLEKARQIAAAA
jgi:hypothetical protein